LGVYSHRRNATVGTGTTRTNHEKITYWFARQIEKDKFDIQPLNIYHVPSGIRIFVENDTFFSSYTPEPAYYQINTVPALKSLHEKILKGEKHLAEGNLLAAEKDFIKALMIDDLNVKANYGLGEVYSDLNQYEKLAKIVNMLMGMEDAFNHEHRARLNSFGVKLRKNGQLDKALVFLEKALEINPKDDHILFNLARVHFDKKDFEACKDTLNAAIQVNPVFAEARKFLSYCQKQSAACV